MTFQNGKPIVPDNPIVPFILGDDTGVDIWPTAQALFPEVVAAASGEKWSIGLFMQGMQRTTYTAYISLYWRSLEGVYIYFDKIEISKYRNIS